ncbi:MAG: hypothetical protein BWK80_47885 [Desulfobacteraceae bacterium IS3]|nr:MAG: hypothetical protein BWK80_47885 [Desulfobacteraceae bacterium IS3]
MKTILIDASSAILLFKCGLFQNLTETYQVIMTQAVYEEVTREGYPAAEEFREYGIRNRIIISPLNEGREAVPSLRGRGEQETVCRYLAGIGDFILIDDRKGAGCCRDKGIPYINALLVPRILFIARKISQADCCRKTAAIIRIGRYSEKIIAYAMNCPEQSVQFFLP